MSLDYEQAVFTQIVKRLASQDGGPIQHHHVEEAFWRVSPELKQAILEQKGANALEDAQEYVRNTFVHALLAQLKAQGEDTIT